MVPVDDLHVEEYNGKSGLKGTLVSFEFVQDGKRESDPQQARQPTQRQASVSNDLDDLDLPF